MNAPHSFHGLSAVRSVAVIAVSATLGACAAPAPQPVEQTVPTVTYSYRSDQELVEATRKADIYCRNYNAHARTVNITDKPDGAYDVVFRCDQAVVAAGPVATVPPPAPVVPSISYTYQTHQQLVEATRQADSYCLNQNARAQMSQIAPNTAGSKTVVFSCVRPL